MDRLKVGLVRAFSFFQWSLEFLAGALLVSVTLIVFVQVILRYFFDTGIAWVEEVSLLCIVWYGFISIAFGLLHKQHICIEAFTLWMPQRIRNLIDRFHLFLIALYGGFTIMIGSELCHYASRQTLPATKWPYTVVYASLFVAGALFILYSLLVATGLYDRYTNFKLKRNIK